MPLFLDICVFELRHISPAWHGQRSVQDNQIEKYGFDLWPKLSHNVTTLDNDDIDISMSHILLFPKIYNFVYLHTIQALMYKAYTFI
jgi:hypothetical protein